LAKYLLIFRHKELISVWFSDFTAFITRFAKTKDTWCSRASTNNSFSIFICP